MYLFQKPASSLECYPNISNCNLTTSASTPSSTALTISLPTTSPSPKVLSD